MFFSNLINIKNIYHMSSLKKLQIDPNLFSMGKKKKRTQKKRKKKYK